MVAYDFEDLRNPKSDENDFGQLESIRAVRNVASRYRDSINILPPLRLLGGFTGPQLATFRSYWLTLDAHDKDTWTKKFSMLLCA